MGTTLKSGDPRVRCAFDKKVIIRDQQMAEARAQEIRDRNRIEGDKYMVAYKCQHGFWHLGHSKAYKRRGWNAVR